MVGLGDASKIVDTTVTPNGLLDTFDPVLGGMPPAASYAYPQIGNHSGRFNIPPMPSEICRHRLGVSKIGGRDLRFWAGDQPKVGEPFARLTHGLLDTRYV